MESVLDVQVSTYRNVKDVEGTPSSLLEWLTSDEWIARVQEIRSVDDPDFRRELKLAMPCATISGTFSSGRSNEALVSHSGLMCLDIDAQDNTGIENWDRLAEELRHIQHFAYVSKSVSGNGYMAIAAIKNPANHKQHYEAMAAELMRLGIKVDAACMNPSRLRTWTHDPEAHINHNAIRYEGLPDPAQRTAKRQRISSPHCEREKVEAIVEEIERTGVDITYAYADWFSLARSLANTFGESGREYYHALSGNYLEYNPSDVDYKFDQALKSPGKATIATLYKLAQDHGINYRLLLTQKRFAL